EHVDAVDLPLVGEASLRGVRGSLEVADGVDVAIEAASVTTRLPQRPRVVLAVDGALQIRDETIAGAASIAGRLGAIPLSGDARLFPDERVAVRLHAGPAAGEALGAWLPPLSDLEGLATVGIVVGGTLTEPRL